MNKIKLYKSVFSTQLPKNAKYIIELKLDNARDVTKTLKLHDDVYQLAMETTMQTLATEKIVGCNYAFYLNDSMIFTSCEQQNEDTQTLSSIISSTATLIFYKTFLSIVLQYQDTAENEEYSEAEKKSIQERIQNLWAALSENPIFSAFTFVDFGDDCVEQIIKNAQRTKKELCSFYSEDCVPEKYIFGVEVLNDEGWISRVKDDLTLRRTEETEE